MLGQPEVEILAWLAENEDATAFDVSHASGMAVVSVRGRLRYLERQRLVMSRPNDAMPPYRVYAITDEGRRKVER